MVIAAYFTCVFQAATQSADTHAVFWPLSQGHQWGRPEGSTTGSWQGQLAWVLGARAG